MLGIISRYVMREFLFTFLVSFCFFFIVFFINILLVTAEEVFTKQVPTAEVARLVLFAFPLIISYSLPFATLLGALMAVSRLSADNEIIALMAAGISLKRLFLPLAAGGVLLSALSFASNDLLLPASTIEFSKVYRRIIYTNPAVELEPFSVKRFPGTAIVTGDFKGSTIDAPLIIDRTDAGESRVITARSATLTGSGAQAGVISLHLRDVFAHIAADGRPDTHEYLRASSMEYNILLRDISSSMVAIGPREMSSIDVWREIQRMRERLQSDDLRRMEEISVERYRLLREIVAAEAVVAADPGRLDDERDRVGEIAARFERVARRTVSKRDLVNYELEFHKKFAIPLACLAFVGLAFPSGLLARRSGRTFGFIVGVAVCFLYWTLLFFGQTGALRTGIDPAVPIWLPNGVVLTAAGVIAVLVRSR